MTQNRPHIEYRQYAGVEDFAPTTRLSRYLRALGQFPTNPLLSVAHTAESADGDIHAVAVIHSLPIVEPFHADPGYGFTLGELFNLTEGFLLQSGAPRVLMHTEHRAMQRMLLQAGAEPWPVSMYQWLRTGGARQPAMAEEM